MSNLAIDNPVFGYPGETLALVVHILQQCLPSI